MPSLIRKSRRKSICCKTYCPTQRALASGTSAVGLLGVGMGGQGALLLAFKQPELFPVVAGIASSIEYHELYGHGTPVDALYDSKEQCRQDTIPDARPPQPSTAAPVLLQ